MRINITIIAEKGFLNLVINNQKHLMIKKVSLHPLLFSQRNSRHFEAFGWFFKVGDL